MKNLFRFVLIIFAVFEVAVEQVGVGSGSIEQTR